MIKSQVPASRLVGRTAPSEQKSASLKTHVSRGNANSGPRRVQGLSSLKRLRRDRERHILWSVCYLRRISREHGRRIIWRKANTFVLALAWATSSLLRILYMLYQEFVGSLTHRTSWRLLRPHESEIVPRPSNLSEILAALDGPLACPAPPQESKESQASPCPEALKNRLTSGCGFLPSESPYSCISTSFSMALASSP